MPDRIKVKYRQTPRQANPQPRLLPERAGYPNGRAPGQERGQQAQPIATGRVKAPIVQPQTQLSPVQAAEMRRELAALLAGRRWQDEDNAGNLN